MIAKFLRDESGATAIEYGLIAALVSVAAITALSAMGDSLSAMFHGRVDSELDGRHAVTEQRQAASRSSRVDESPWASADRT